MLMLHKCRHVAVGWPWLCARCPPSCSLAFPPQQDRGRKWDVDQNKDREILYQNWQKLVYCQLNRFGWRETKRRNETLSHCHAICFPRLNITSSLPALYLLSLEQFREIRNGVYGQSIRVPPAVPSGHIHQPHRVSPRASVPSLLGSLLPSIPPSALPSGSTMEQLTCRQNSKSHTHPPS